MDAGIAGVEERLRRYQKQGARRAGLCAEAVMTALGARRQGCPDAAAVWQLVPPSQRHRMNAPRGAIVYWSGGSGGHGHTCFALGYHLELSVDVIPGHPGAAGVVPFVWFRENWPELRYEGWSWYWGSIDTTPVAPVPASPALAAG